MYLNIFHFNKLRRKQPGKQTKSRNEVFISILKFLENKFFDKFIIKKSILNMNISELKLITFLYYHEEKKSLQSLKLKNARILSSRLKVL